MIFLYSKGVHEHCLKNLNMRYLFSTYWKWKIFSNIGNLRYHDNTTIKLPLIYLERHFQSNFSHDRKRMCIFTIQHLVNIIKTRSNMVVQILRDHGNKTSTISDFSKNVICKAIYLPSATVHIFNKTNSKLSISYLPLLINSNSSYLIYVTTAI